MRDGRKVLGAVVAVVVPVVALALDPVHPWWVAVVVAVFAALPMLVWVAVARSRLTGWVALLVLPALLLATFAVSALQPGRVRPPAWDFLVAFGAVVSLLLLLVEGGRARPRRWRPYVLGIGVLLLSLLAAGGSAVVRHEELGELSVRPSSADIPPLPDGFSIIATATDCAEFCGGLVALAHPDRPRGELADALRRFLDAGWEPYNLYHLDLEFIKRGGGFLDWHHLHATISFGLSPVDFPDIHDPNSVMIGMSKWVPIMKP